MSYKNIFHSDVQILEGESDLGADSPASVPEIKQEPGEEEEDDVVDENLTEPETDEQPSSDVDINQVGQRCFDEQISTLNLHALFWINASSRLERIKWF